MPLYSSLEQLTAVSDLAVTGIADRVRALRDAAIRLPSVA